MKKSSLIGASSLVILYWLLDAFAQALLYDDVSFADAILLHSPHTLGWIKGIIALSLFATTLIILHFLSPKSVAEPPRISHEFEALQPIADTLFSSLSLKVNMLKSLDLFQTLLQLDTVVLFTYAKESLTLYNENEFIKHHFHAKEIQPSKANPKRSEIENVAILCFQEQRLSSKEIVTLDNHTYTLFSFAITEGSDAKPIGNLMLVTQTPQSIEAHFPMIKYYKQMLTFVLALSMKHDTPRPAVTENQAQPIAMLDNTSKLREHLEHGFYRHKRYHTPLSIILIEINMLKNITNIFPLPVTNSMKTELLQLLMKNKRDTDIVGKWSNDRFAILLPDVDFRAGQGLVKRLQNLLKTTKFQQIGTISCSFGITSLSPLDTIANFKMRAENALEGALVQEGDTVEVKLRTT